MSSKSSKIILLSLAALAILSGCARPTFQSTLPDLRVESGKWIMPRDTQGDEEIPMWGVKDGIVVGTYPARFSFLGEDGGPRGLLRLGYESGGVVRFINFLVITPVESRGEDLIPFGSELTKSPSDGDAGIRFFPYPIDFMDDPNKYPKAPELDRVGRVEGRGTNEALTFGIRTERFPNGAECFLVVRIYADRPNEAEFETYLLRGQSRTKNVVLSTTWGNMTRLRELYLKGGIVTAKKLYGDFSGSGFAPMKFFRASQLQQNRGKDLVFIAGPDEDQPWKTQPYPHSTKLLQYFLKKPGTWTDGLRAMVNGRAVYWKTSKRVPGGMSFENFNLVEDFRQGQTTTYGFYHGSVQDLLDGRRSSPIR